MPGSNPAQTQIQPASDEIEVTIFGAGYGESIIIHIGQGNWIIIDSTLSRDSANPSALDYLNKLGIDVATQVKTVIVTHWHDDHIKGIAEIAKQCSQAEFFISSALMNAKNAEKFKNLVFDSALSRRVRLSVNSASGIDEFIKLFDVLIARNSPPDYAFRGTNLYIDQVLDIHVSALTPHKSVFEQAIDAIISQLPDQNGTIKKLRAPTPNFCSVVVWLKIGDTRILLGADLEEVSAHRGWSLIVSDKQKSSSVIDGKAELFKVAHHGSVTGHYNGIWDELLTENPICLIAPFSRSPKLPTQADIKRIKELSTEAYLTAFHTRAKTYKDATENVVLKKFADRNATFGLERLSYVRARKKPGQNWQVQTHGSAINLSSIT